MNCVCVRVTTHDHKEKSIGNDGPNISECMMMMMMIIIAAVAKGRISQETQCNK